LRLAPESLGDFRTARSSFLGGAQLRSARQRSDGDDSPLSITFIACSSFSNDANGRNADGLRGVALDTGTPIRPWVRVRVRGTKARASRFRSQDAPDQVFSLKARGSELDQVDSGQNHQMRNKTCPSDRRVRRSQSSQVCGPPVAHIDRALPDGAEQRLARSPQTRLMRPVCRRASA
jgi:hypothetical protein